MNGLETSKSSCYPCLGMFKSANNYGYKRISFQLT